MTENRLDKYSKTNTRETQMTESRIHTGMRKSRRMGTDDYACCLDYGDSFTGMYIVQNLPNCRIQIHAIDIISITLRKSENKAKNQNNDSQSFFTRKHTLIGNN